MIEETLNLLRRIDAAPEAITMLDGDGLEINIIRDGQRMTILHVYHNRLKDDGQPAPVDPLPIQITIERAEQGSVQRPFSDESN